MDFLTGS